jgi:hypothetical protein
MHFVPRSVFDVCLLERTDDDKTDDENVSEDLGICQYLNIFEEIYAIKIF